MIRRGKSQGWLDLPVSSLRDWASINECKFNRVKFGPLLGLEDRGTAITYLEDKSTTEWEPLIIVPRELILSCESVQLYAKSDRHLREALESVGDFARTARGAILIFLLVQSTHNCPDLGDTIGASSGLTDYIKYLPLEDLPTFWSDNDLAMLVGTSLAPALEAKLNSLYKEFNHLRRATADVPWCQKYWWDEVDGILTFDDWKQVDAMYRSRALEFPGIGDAMVPCIDMANHASGANTVALYESNAAGNGLLLLRSDHSPSTGEEITITYGDEKGACEMLFSYGFIEAGVETARDVLLSLDIPNDDPLRTAKRAVAVDAPGVRLYDTTDGMQWESEYIWLICVNEEDGFEIDLVQTVTGDRELSASFKGQQISSTQKLKPLLESDDSWDIFHLRAVTLLHGRVEEQLQELMRSEAVSDHESAENLVTQSRRRNLIRRLRTLEFELLERFYEFFESEQTRLFQTDAVQRYLSSASHGEASVETEDDFS